MAQTRDVFPTDDSLREVMYLGITRAAWRWTLPTQDWMAPRSLFSFRRAGTVTPEMWWGQLHGPVDIPTPQPSGMHDAM